MLQRPEVTVDLEALSSVEKEEDDGEPREAR
jgi:hypothetical protein